jgi:dihydrofolate reductase
MIRLIAAMDKQRGIADEHGIPWHGKIPLDTKRFHDQTAHGIIVMGYGTYLEYDKPLHDRENFVVSRPDTGELRAGFAAVPDADQFFDLHAHELIWVIGGAALFSATLGRAQELVLTRLDADFHCTKFFPAFSDDFELENDEGPYVENDVSFRFETLRRVELSGSPGRAGRASR